MYFTLFCLPPPVCIAQRCIVGRLTNCSFPSKDSRLPGCDECGYSQALFSSLCLFSFFFHFFENFVGVPPSRCDLLRFSEVWSGLTGAFMHLVFPPFLPSGSLKSKFHRQLWSVLNVFVCFFFYCTWRYLHLLRLQSRCFLRNNVLLRRFHARTISCVFFSFLINSVHVGKVRYRAAFSVSSSSYKPPVIWCDTIPPPAALHPELHGPWVTKRGQRQINLL